jgi:hypothetical protein
MHCISLYNYLIVNLKRSSRAAYTCHVTRPRPSPYLGLTLTDNHSVCIVSILRLQSLVAISNSTDPTYDNPPAATWSSVEINVGIICSCLPLLRPILTRFLPGGFTSRVRSVTTGPKQYATIQSTHGSKMSKSRGESSIELTKYDGDIQVVTDISVQVDAGSGRLSMWKAPRSTCGLAAKEDIKKKQDRTETLKKDVGQIV